ncbi:MAG: LLM class flavin-dependent oxidoreductase [Nitrososphaerota archaeon]|nr:LLM class flavin-dependent oxidoreductase [Candidatus Bathyarchaeota archaeon]MDW8048499.1 LLM class flavin-dependent oxidoreductase [Nitrososphaerota archaeon]
MKKIKFGLRVPSFPVDGSSGKIFIDQISVFISDVEGFFDSAWIDDHFVPWAESVPRSTPNLECFTTISFLSGVFRKLEFGTLVLCVSYRHPSIVAKMGATLHSLTGGRFILGLGAGWKQDEYLSFGFEFPPPKVRIKQLEEAAQIIRRLWTEDVVSFRGDYYHLEEAVCSPKPVPPPPIMIGGGGEKLTLRVVARNADWWNIPNASIETYRHKSGVLERYCLECGRDPSSIVKTLASIVAIRPDENDALVLASKCPLINMDYRDNYIIGDVSKIIERIDRYVGLGVQHFILRFIDFPGTEGARLFAEEVMPSFS